MGTVKMETKWRDVRKMTFMWRKKNNFFIYQVLAWLKTDKCKWENSSKGREHFCSYFLQWLCWKDCNPIFVPHLKISELMWHWFYEPINRNAAWSDAFLHLQCLKDAQLVISCAAHKEFYERTCNVKHLNTLRGWRMNRRPNGTLVQSITILFRCFGWEKKNNGAC